GGLRRAVSCRVRDGLISPVNETPPVKVWVKIAQYAALPNVVEVGKLSILHIVVVRGINADEVHRTIRHLGQVGSCTVQDLCRQLGACRNALVKGLDQRSYSLISINDLIESP